MKSKKVFPLLSRKNYKSLKERDICVCPLCEKNVRVVVIVGGELGLQKHGDCIFSGKSFVEISEINDRAINMVIIFSILLPNYADEFLDDIKNMV